MQGQSEKKSETATDTALPFSESPSITEDKQAIKVTSAEGKCEKNATENTVVNEAIDTESTNVKLLAAEAPDVVNNASVQQQQSASLSKDNSLAVANDDDTMDGVLEKATIDAKDNIESKDFSGQNTESSSAPDDKTE